MRIAYDTILLEYVDADSAAKNYGHELYRYLCACCGEEVHLCAVNSVNQVAHFRHRKGNNNKQCENYLGNNYNSIIKNQYCNMNLKRDKIEFYFLCSKKIFSICMKLNNEEISMYEKKESIFQVKTTFNSKPIIKIPIKRSFFCPDVYEFIPVDKFSWEYYVYIGDLKKYKMELFKKDDRGFMLPCIFKIQSDAYNNELKAKLVRGNTIYTNEPYLIVYAQSYKSIKFESDAIIDKINFKTMNIDFTGIFVTFNKITPEIEKQLKEWNYNIETNEILTILWPPTSRVDESIQISNDYVYISSTFEIKAHGNINLDSEEISNLGNGIYKVFIKGLTKIYKKNTELIFEKCEEQSHNYEIISVIKESAKSYMANDNDAYLFTSSGVYPIRKGTSIRLTPYCEIRHYRFGYLDSIITGVNNSNVLKGEHFLQDVLKYYKRTEKFLLSDFKSIKLSETAIKYIKGCKKTGLINSAAKRFIQEGLI